MIVCVHGKSTNEVVEWFGAGLVNVLAKRGAVISTNGEADPRLVINLLDENKPRPFRRKGQGTFVIGIVAGTADPHDILRSTYPFLIRSLSNMLIYLVVPEGQQVSRPTEVWFITPEQGHYSVRYDNEPDEQFFASVYERVEPVATARLVINNIFETDLEESLYEGDEITQALRTAGQKLDQLNLLPAPFPLEEYLPPREIAHIQRLYSMGGLSYGNLSARKDGQRFWMSASGVDKSNLVEIGRDLLLVKGYDESRNAIVLSVPPHVTPRRVSVDAIEHWMIYTQNPGVGAIVHVHAWMDGVMSTQINYPCGTYELGEAVATLVRQSPDPNRAIIGLKNHGLTITGPDLDDIFERIEGRILPQVPMTS